MYEIALQEADILDMALLQIALPALLEVGLPESASLETAPFEVALPESALPETVPFEVALPESVFPAIALPHIDYVGRILALAVV